MSRVFFITGTDTGVGKTVVANALLKLANDRGLLSRGLKPVAAGCYLREGRQVNEDAWDLMHTASLKSDYETVNPIALREPMAPHIAAEREGVDLQAHALAKHCAALLPGADFTVIEGAGGWLVPLNATETVADIAVELNTPVILVVGLRLGCINHALLTAAAIRNSRLTLAGWVANCIDPEMAVPNENIATLEARLDAPLLGVIPPMENPGAVFAAPHLNFDALP